MTSEEKEALRKERACLKMYLFGWRYGVPEEQWPDDVKAAQERFAEITKRLLTEPEITPTGRIIEPPAFQHLPAASKEAKEIIEAFRKSHSPEIEQLNIDYASLELLVMADLINKQDKEKL